MLLHWNKLALKRYTYYIFCQDNIRVSRSIDGKRALLSMTRIFNR